MMQPPRSVAPLLLLGALLMPRASAQPKNVDLEVVPAAAIEIQTFVVQDKASRPIGTDKATLAVGKKGGVKKTVTLKPGKKSKATGEEEVEIRLVVMPKSSSSLAVDLEIEAVATPKGTSKPSRTRVTASLPPGATKLVNLYEHPTFGASVMAMLKAEKADPVVKLEGLPEAKASAPKSRSLRSTTFDIVVERREDGEKVFEENVTLNTWMGDRVEYETAYEIPTEVTVGGDGLGKVTYAADKAKLVLHPIELVGSELKVEATVRGTIHRGSDLVHGFPLDRSVTIMLRAGQPLELYAIFGQEDIRGLDPGARATASGYVFHVTPRY